MIQIKAPFGVPCHNWGRATKGGDMFQLTMILFSVIGTALAGSAVIAVLTMGYDTLQPILLAAGAGALAAVPLSWVIAKRLT